MNRSNLYFGLVGLLAGASIPVMLPAVLPLSQAHEPSECECPVCPELDCSECVMSEPDPAPPEDEAEAEAEAEAEEAVEAALRAIEEAEAVQAEKAEEEAMMEME